MHSRHILSRAHILSTGLLTMALASTEFARFVHTAVTPPGPTHFHTGPCGRQSLCRPHLRSRELRSTFSSVYVNDLEFCTGDISPPPPFNHLLNYQLVLVWTHGHLLYTSGLWSGTTLCSLFLQFSQLWLRGALSVDSWVPLSWLHQYRGWELIIAFEHFLSVG